MPLSYTNALPNKQHFSPPISSHHRPYTSPANPKPQTLFSPAQDSSTSIPPPTFIGSCTHELVVSHVLSFPNRTLGRKEAKAYIPARKGRLKHPPHQSNRNRIVPPAPPRRGKPTDTLRIALKCHPFPPKKGENRHTIFATALP